MNRESPNEHIGKRVLTADIDEALVHGSFTAFRCPTMESRHEDWIEVIGASERRISTVAFDGSTLVIVVCIPNENNVSRDRLLPIVIGIAEKFLDGERVEETITEFIVDVADINHHCC